MADDTKLNVKDIKRTFEDGALESLSIVRPPTGQSLLSLRFKMASGEVFSTSFLYTGGVSESHIKGLSEKCPHNARLYFKQRNQMQRLIHSVEIENGPKLIAHWGF